MENITKELSCHPEPFYLPTDHKEKTSEQASFAKQQKNEMKLNK